MRALVLAGLQRGFNPAVAKDLGVAADYRVAKMPQICSYIIDRSFLRRRFPSLRLRSGRLRQGVPAPF